MAMPESPIPPQVVANIGVQLQMLVVAQRETTTASLVAAVIAAKRKPVSIAEVLEIQTDVYWSMFPDARSAAYQLWAKTKDERLTKPHD
jgi:hypothetical protein